MLLTGLPQIVAAQGIVHDFSLRSTENKVMSLSELKEAYSDPSFLVSNNIQLNLNYWFRGFKASGRAEYFVNLPPGLYFVQMNLPERSFSRKLIVNH